MKAFSVSSEDFAGTKEIYDITMADNVELHDVIYPHVFGADQYIGQFSDNSREEIELMASLMKLDINACVLDVGCGCGNIAAHIAQTFHWHVSGVDLAEIPVQQAKSRYENRDDLRINFQQGSIYNLASENCFDGIYGTGAFCHFDSEKLFKHCHKLLKAGGKIAFMERIRIGNIAAVDWERLTTKWCCPYVYSLEEYQYLLVKCGYNICHTLDLTDNFKIWQSRSVSCRKELKEQIIRNSSVEYYQKSLDFAMYENDVTESGALGYVCLIAERE